MSPELERLITMHTYQRPADSRAERKFIRRYILPLGAKPDGLGNYIRVIGDSPRHVWSSHTDTVHKRSGKQRVYLDANGVLSSSSGDCLGADDTAGVWLMCELMRRGVSGRYVFHFGEERGCIGSRRLVASEPAWLTAIDAVIALDRKDTCDVITHQMGQRTASDAFADSLAAALNACGLAYAASDWGMYTDSESYSECVSECTNLSVGYSGAHGAAETLDTKHTLALLDALTRLDVASLTIARDPAEPDDDYPWNDASDLVSSETYWSNHGEIPDTTLPVARVTRLSWCRDCSSTVRADAAFCIHCGCEEPNSDDYNRASDYSRYRGLLSETYGEVQEALELLRRKRGGR